YRSVCSTPCSARSAVHSSVWASHRSFRCCDMTNSPNQVLTVTNVYSRNYAGRLRRPFVTSRRRVEEVTGLLETVALDDGTDGRGSAAATLQLTGESVETMRAAIHGPVTEALTNAPVLGGLRGHADAIAAACVANTSAKAAVH